MNPNAPELLTPQEVAEFLGVGVGTLTVWRSTGRYPLKFVRVGRRIRYRRRDVEAFLDERTATSTGQLDAAVA